MIITEIETIGTAELAHTYSDAGMMFRKDDSPMLYQEFYCRAEIEHTYTETDIPIPEPEPELEPELVE